MTHTIYYIYYIETTSNNINKEITMELAFFILILNILFYFILYIKLRNKIDELFGKITIGMITKSDITSVINHTLYNILDPSSNFKDELLFEVEKYIIEYKTVTKKEIQNYFTIGEMRASRIINQLLLINVCKMVDNSLIPLITIDELYQMARKGEI
jgi:DNA integrity scanning protein DisA with diadenylate cyclase activity